MKLDRLFITDRLKPPAAPPPPSPQMRSSPTPCTPTRSPCSTRARPTSPLLITVKEVCSPWGPGLGPTPRNCASVSQVLETWRPDPWLRVGWTGPAVCRWNTATTPVMPCCSVTVGTVGCPLSGMHQPVTPPVLSPSFLSCLLHDGSLCWSRDCCCSCCFARILPARAVAATLGDFQTEENLDLTQKSCSSVFIFREVAGAASPEDTDLWGGGGGGAEKKI